MTKTAKPAVDCAGVPGLAPAHGPDSGTSADQHSWVGCRVACGGSEADHCRRPQSGLSWRAMDLWPLLGARPTDDHLTSPFLARGGYPAPLIVVLTATVHQTEIHPEDLQQRGRSRGGIDESIRRRVRDIGLCYPDEGTRGCGRADRVRDRWLEWGARE